MKIGDLVNFYTSSWVFDNANDQYANPGIVLSCSDPIKKHVVAEVYWRDGKITHEHSSYLHHFTSKEMTNESR